MKLIQRIIAESIEAKQALLENEEIINGMCALNERIVISLQEGNKLLLCGNGGSAADAEHIAGELSGRFKMDRKALFAEALHVNGPAITAIANDYGYDQIYARMVESKGRSGDILMAYSTSGNSTNVIKALIKAKEIGMHTIGFTGSEPGEMDKYCDHLIKVPSSNVPRIQEMHLLLGHATCEIVELKIFDPK